MNHAMPAPESADGPSAGEPAGATPAPESVEPVAPRETHEPAEAAPLGVGREPTGHPGVDAHLARLGAVDHLPADGHLEVYEDVHRGLRAELTSLDAHPAPRPYENRS
ncbi:hypothetical protein [Streptomyces sp. NPDC002057]|uniref:hypothetical protein n=1 Tax=Streptomyces sp. NPDC002057 TaxID=3154664 RepID=UPI00331A2E80